MATVRYTRLADPSDNMTEDSVLSSSTGKHRFLPLALVELSSTLKTVIPWSFYLAWMSTGLSTIMACVAAYITFFTFKTTSVAPSVQPSSLKRLTPYVNPDLLRQAIQAHGTRFKPIQNVAVSTFQMKPNDLLRVLTEDTSRQWHSSLGDVWPEDRHVIVNRSVSTVLQYRNRDFDMEDCILTITVPRSTSDFNPAVSLVSGSVIDIWMLAPTEELFLDGDSTAASPRLQRLMTVELVPAIEATSVPFQCASGDFTTMELACSSQSTTCSADFWQTRAVKTGFVLVQRQSGIGLDVSAGL